MGCLKEFFKGPEYFTLEKEREYALSELIEILKTKDVTPATGNAIVLKILDALVKNHEKPS